MDNGLIFPYPQKSAHTEPGNAKRQKLRILREERWIARPEPVVGKRWGDAGR
jgi:hypothetical protein